MIESYVVYRSDTGMITKVVHCIPDVIVLQLEPGETYMRGTVSDDSVYVDTQQQQIIPRPVMPVYLQGNCLKGVPNGATISIDAAVYRADGTDIELEFSLPGIYGLRISHWPYLDWEGTYEAQA